MQLQWLDIVINLVYSNRAQSSRSLPHSKVTIDVIGKYQNNIVIPKNGNTCHHYTKVTKYIKNLRLSEN